MIQSYNKNRKYDLIEPFCGACLAIPLAFAGAGSGVYGSSKSHGSYKKQRKIQFISIVVNFILLIISLILWWFFYIHKKCTSCR
jgi:hypothetical protein